MHVGENPMSILQKSSTRNFSDNFKYKKILIVFILLSILLSISFLLSICYGSVQISFKELIECLFNNESKLYQIVTYVRLPRAIAALFSGAALAVSGSILQSVLNNSLVSPKTIGINSGAGLFVAICITLFPNDYQLIHIAAFIGALLTTLLIYVIAYKTGASRITVILIGIAVSSFLGAGTDAIATLFPDSLVGSNAFSAGNFAATTLETIKPALICISIGLIASFITSYDLNVMALGDQTAYSLGMNIVMYRFVFIIIASLLAGSAVSFSGLLSFVGLIVPHAARILVGHDNRLLIPASMLLGSTFCLICDLISRVIFSPFEVPVGIIMSFIGGPFFVYLLFRQKRGRLYD